MEAEEERLKQRAMKLSVDEARELKKGQDLDILPSNVGRDIYIYVCVCVYVLSWGVGNENEMCVFGVNGEGYECEEMMYT